MMVSLISVYLLTKRCLKRNEESSSNRTQKKDTQTSKRSGIQMGKSTVPSKKVRRDKRSLRYICGHSCFKPDFHDNNYVNNLSSLGLCHSSRLRHSHQTNYPPQPECRHSSRLPFVAKCGACAFLGSLDPQCVHCYNNDHCSR